jgi:hypothetical protein
VVGQFQSIQDWTIITPFVPSLHRVKFGLWLAHFERASMSRTAPSQQRLFLIRNPIDQLLLRLGTNQ